LKITIALYKGLSSHIFIFSNFQFQILFKQRNARKDPKKISWKTRLVLAEKAISMKFVVQKEYLG